MAVQGAPFHQRREGLGLFAGAKMAYLLTGVEVLMKAQAAELGRRQRRRRDLDA